MSTFKSIFKQIGKEPTKLPPLLLSSTANQQLIESPFKTALNRELILIRDKEPVNIQQAPSFRTNLQIEEVVQPKDPHTLRVGLIGLANSGKSTFLNALMTYKVSITSNKAQTTRRQHFGVYSRGNKQIVITDAPGISTPEQEKKLRRSLQSASWNTLKSNELVVCVIDASKPSLKLDYELLQKIPQCIILLNKIDLTKTKQLADVASKFMEFGYPIFEISSRTMLGMNTFRQYLFDKCTPGHWMFPANCHSLDSDFEKAKELVRERLFYEFEQEIPYSIEPEILSWEEKEDSDLIKLHVQLVLRHAKYTKLLLGKGGQMLQAVRDESTKSLQKLLKKKVLIEFDTSVDGNAFE